MLLKLNMLFNTLCFCTVILLICNAQDDECEVCESLCNGFKDSHDIPSLVAKNELVTKMTTYCESLPHDKKEWKVCQNIGAIENAPTSLMGDVNQLFKNNLPCNVVCQKLKKKDPQICEYKFVKQLTAADLTKEKLKKYKVSKLKKILIDWGEEHNFVEKRDYVDKIEEVKHKYLKEEL